MVIVFVVVWVLSCGMGIVDRGLVVVVGCCGLLLFVVSWHTWLSVVVGGRRWL